MITTILQVVDIAGAIVVPTMERRRKRKQVDDALEAHQEDVGKFEDDGDYPEIEGPHFDRQKMIDREMRINLLKKKIGMK